MYIINVFSGLQYSGSPHLLLMRMLNRNVTRLWKKGLMKINTLYVPHTTTKNEIISISRGAGRHSLIELPGLKNFPNELFKFHFLPASGLSIRQDLSLHPVKDHKKRVCVHQYLYVCKFDGIALLWHNGQRLGLQYFSYMKCRQLVICNKILVMYEYFSM